MRYDIDYGIVSIVLFQKRGWVGPIPCHGAPPAARRYGIDARAPFLVLATLLATAAG